MTLSGNNDTSVTREDKAGPQASPSTPHPVNAFPAQPKLPLQPQQQPQQAQQSPQQPLPQQQQSQQSQEQTTKQPSPQRFVSPRKVAVNFMEGPNSPAPQTICSPCTEGTVATTPTTAAAELLRGSLTRGKIMSSLSPSNEQKLTDRLPLASDDNGNNNNIINNNNNNNIKPSAVAVPGAADANTIAKKYQLTHAEAVATVRPFHPSTHQSIHLST